LAVKVESLGYSTLTIHDHIGEQLAPIPALATAAAVTRDLRLGTLVLDNDFRHPCLLANEIATVDHLSDGRVEWGMGAGWLPQDYERSGLPFDRAGERVVRLQESIAVMKELFGGGPVDFEGTSYQVAGAVVSPGPTQRPHPPLLLGAQGRRLLGYGARAADIVGINPSFTTMPLFGKPPRQGVVEAFDDQVEWVRAAAGPRLDQLEINVVAMPAAVVGDTSEKIARMAANTGGDPDQIAESPHVLVGSVDQICEVLEARRARWGVSYYVVPPNALDDFAPVVARMAGR
jgi:probable F420-dependent oxidoreductase